MKIKNWDPYQWSEKTELEMRLEREASEKKKVRVDFFIKITRVLLTILWIAILAVCFRKLFIKLIDEKMSNEKTVTSSDILPKIGPFAEDIPSPKIDEDTLDAMPELIIPEPTPPSTFKDPLPTPTPKGPTPTPPEPSIKSADPPESSTKTSSFSYSDDEMNYLEKIFEVQYIEEDMNELISDSMSADDCRKYKQLAKTHDAIVEEARYIFIVLLDEDKAGNISEKYKYPWVYNDTSF